MAQRTAEEERRKLLEAERLQLRGKAKAEVAEGQGEERDGYREATCPRATEAEYLRAQPFFETTFSGSSQRQQKRATVSCEAKCIASQPAAR